MILYLGLGLPGKFFGSCLGSLMSLQYADGLTGTELSNISDLTYRTGVLMLTVSFSSPADVIQ